MTEPFGHNDVIAMGKTRGRTATLVRQLDHGL